MNNIPKVIHYFWFGPNKKPEIFDFCINTWKKYCPDYEIKLWTEKNFDVNIIPYCADAYKQKKYSLVADYARLYTLYNYGGIYLDIDVEMVKNIDKFLEHECFMGFEQGGKVAPGLIIGAKKGSIVIKELMQIYKNLNGCSRKNQNIWKEVTKFLKESKKLEIEDKIQHLDGITIYPQEYFCASNWVTKEITPTENTYCIHHYAGSWLKWPQKIKVQIRKILLKKL